MISYELANMLKFPIPSLQFHCLPPLAFSDVTCFSCRVLSCLFRPPNLTSRAVRLMVTMITRSTSLIWTTLALAVDVVCAAAAGWERAGRYPSWMITNLSLTPVCPAQKTSSVKLSRSPRTSRSCWGLHRRTSMRALYPAQKEYMWLWMRWRPSSLRDHALRQRGALCAY